MTPPLQRTCSHSQQAPDEILTALPTSQAGTGRHKCAVCAYAAGLADGMSGARGANLETCSHNSQAPEAALENLALSQGGAERHKCTNCAYERGFHKGQGAALIAADALETERDAHGEDAAEVEDEFSPRSEGQKKTRLHTVYERSPENRARAIELQGTTCAACGFDFDRFYGGDFARHYIEVHHVESVATLNGRLVDPARDLVPLCSNCHSMAHRQSGRVVPVDELKALIEAAQAPSEGDAS